LGRRKTRKRGKDKKKNYFAFTTQPNTHKGRGVGALVSHPGPRYVLLRQKTYNKVDRTYINKILTCAKPQNPFIRKNRDHIPLTRGIGAPFGVTFFFIKTKSCLLLTR